MSDEFFVLFQRAGKVLGIAQSDLARHLGVSVRTPQRWAIGQGGPNWRHLETLAEMSQSRDLAFADELYRAVDAILVGSGQELPPRPNRIVAQPQVAESQPPPPTPTPTTHVDPALIGLLTDATVAAAADVLRLSPNQVRPALRAAMSAAMRGGLSVEMLVSALGTGEIGANPRK